MSAALEEILAHYGIGGKIVSEKNGPLLRLVEFAPAPGTKIKNVLSAREDIARELGVSSVDVEKVPDSGNIWFEIPDRQPRTVDFKTLVDSEVFQNFKGKLPLCLGTDVAGDPVIADLSKMPHLLVAGTTGSGKSVGLNTFILSLILAKETSELKLVLIDPKRIEFSIYNDQQYMLMPVVTENKDAAAVLAYLVGEMERRYRQLEESHCRNIDEYHLRVGLMPYIVCIIDEFADLVTVSPEVEKYIRLLAQKARACGIHLILATQRPSVDVVTGVLKANFPSRLAYKTAASADSRTVLDTTGAEKLLGRGDALFSDAAGGLKRIHGAYVADNDIREILEPFRGKVEELSLEEYQVPEKEKKHPAPQKEPGVFRRLLNWWSSLKVRERKTLVSGIVYLFSKLTAAPKRRRK